MKQSIFLLFIATIFIASCGGNKSNSADELAKLKKDRAELDQKIAKLDTAKKDSVKRSPVTVAVVQPTTFTGYVDVQSQVTGDENVLASPQVPGGGTVTSVLVHPGQSVKKGQPLAMLDAVTIDQQISELQPQLTLQKTLYEKQQRLWAQEIGTQVQLLQAKANYEGGQRQLAALQSQRSLYRIVSPIDGNVDAVTIKVGDVALPGGGATQSGIRVVSYSKLKIEANLGESYLGKVKQGDPVTIVFPDINDSLKTTLTYVAQAVDNVSRSFVVQVRLGNNPKLHPNMSCRMKIANYSNSNVMVVPVNLIQRTGAGDILYVANGNVAKAVVVTTGHSSNGQVEILSGLNAGDKLITAGYEDLDNNSPIAVQQ